MKKNLVEVNQKRKWSQCFLLQVISLLFVFTMKVDLKVNQFLFWSSSTDVASDPLLFTSQLLRNSDPGCYLLILLTFSPGCSCTFGVNTFLLYNITVRVCDSYMIFRAEDNCTFKALIISKYQCVVTSFCDHTTPWPDIMKCIVFNSDGIYRLHIASLKVLLA